MNRQPSLRNANVLFLISTLLIVTAGTALQTWSITWGLILTEILLILVPTLAAIRLQRLDWRDTLRLRHWPGWWPMALGPLIGAPHTLVKYNLYGVTYLLTGR